MLRHKSALRLHSTALGRLAFQCSTAVAVQVIILICMSQHLYQMVPERKVFLQIRFCSTPCGVSVQMRKNMWVHLLVLCRAREVRSVR